MKFAVSRLCLLLLAASFGCAAGCVNNNDNPVYFPHLFASPYENYDPNAVRLEVRPLDIPNDSTHPVGMQHIIIATVYDKNNTPRRGRRIEWIIEGVGSIIEVDRKGSIEKERERQRAVSTTALFEHRITRGTADPNDDTTIRPGQTWCVISSPVEGDTHVTVYAPEIFDWTKRKVTRTIRWMDAMWDFPPNAQVPTGAQYVLTTRIYRHTDKLPLAKYRVRYRIDGGSPAIFIPSQTQEYDAVSNLEGNAQVAITQTAPGPGVTRIAVEIIRPPDPTAPSGSGILLARGDTAIEWLAPTITLSHTGPAMAIVGSEVTYETTVVNSGKVASQAMTVSGAMPDGLKFARATPKEFFDAQTQTLIWALPTLPPGQAHKIQATYVTTRPGPVSSCVAVETKEGIKDSKCAQTNVTTAGLKVAITGPPVANVGVPINFQITVSNPGSGPLDNAILTANFPEELEDPLNKDRHALFVNLGTLAPQENRPVPLQLTARAAGKFTVQATATAANLSDRAATVVTVQKPQVSLDIVGPRTAFVGRPGNWSLVIENAGDVPLNNVVLRDRLPPEFASAQSDQGGKIENGEVLWTVGQMQAREKRTLKLTAVGKIPAKSAVQSATVTADGGIQASAQNAVELINTPAGLEFEVEDRGNPVQFGKTIVYTIKFKNTGQTPAQQVGIKAIVPRELKIISAKGPSAEQVNGQLVLFGVLNDVLPGQELTYTVEAEAANRGKSDVRFRAELTTLGINPGEPVVREEATSIIYPDAVPPPPQMTP